MKKARKYGLFTLSSRNRIRTGDLRITNALLYRAEPRKPVSAVSSTRLPYYITECI